MKFIEKGDGVARDTILLGANDQIELILPGRAFVIVKGNGEVEEMKAGYSEMLRYED